MNDLSEFDPAEVASIVRVALAEKRLLPLSFIETEFFEHFYGLLSKTMNSSDLAHLFSEARSYFLHGFTRLSSKELHDLIHNCRRCPAAQPAPVQPSWNCIDPDLYILVDNPSQLRNADEFFSALKQAGFASSRCMLSYSTRCNLVNSTHLISELSSCFSYLHTEIATVSPKLILTLGSFSFSSLTGDSSQKLTEIMGSIIWYGPYAVMPEVSPAWLYFKNKENTRAIFEHYLESFSKAHTFIYGEPHAL